MNKRNWSNKGGGRPVEVRLRLGLKTVIRHLSRVVFNAVGARVPASRMLVPSIVVAPHPDDETFGCGGLIARLSAADVPVTVIIVSDGAQGTTDSGGSPARLIKQRESEAHAAIAALGLKRADVRFLGFCDGGLTDRLPEVTAALAETISATRPAHVFVTSAMDRHPDHAATAKAARAACASRDPAPRLFEYPIWQRVPAASGLRGMLRDTSPRDAKEQSGRLQRLRRARPWLLATDNFLAVKRDAIDAYPSQVPLLPPGFVADLLGPDEIFFPVNLDDKSESSFDGG